MSQILHHSAEIDIYLLIAGERFEVASCLGTCCSVRTPRNIAPCYAELVISIDGQEQRKLVHLRYGISQDRRDVEFDNVCETSSAA